MQILQNYIDEVYIIIKTTGLISLCRFFEHLNPWK